MMHYFVIYDEENYFLIQTFRYILILSSLCIFAHKLIDRKT